MGGHKNVTVATDYLGRQVDVIMDRPLHSRHPRHGWEYLLNYGFVPGTLSPDGEEPDAYVMGVEEPLTRFSGICAAVIRRLNDNDDKLVVVPAGRTSFSDDEIRAATHFQEQFFQSRIVRSR